MEEAHAAAIHRFNTLHLHLHLRPEIFLWGAGSMTGQSLGFMIRGEMIMVMVMLMILMMMVMVMRG